MTARGVTWVRPPEWTWAKDADYAQAVRYGELVLTCGVAPLDELGNVVGAGLFELQLRRVVQNLRELLETAGAELGSILRQQVFLTRAADIDAFRSLRRELYRPPFPTSIVVVVSELVMPEMLVEIACEALVTGRTSQED
jgi:enamine deaminase RidA (YjgF/YER057c/UK114 family)